jgi:DNA (cytosine-5)-methyltransferase 1
MWRTAAGIGGGMMRVLDLFSGLGAFSLGLERTGGFRTVAFCECEPFPRRILAKHWPGVPIYDDVRSLTAARLAADGIGVDVICGGFPCQDLSRAGTGRGLAGDRSGLWSEFARLIRELRPGYALVENVPALLDGELGAVLRDLSERGFDAEWSVVSACSMGAPHMRQRVFVVAYPDGEHGRAGVRHTASQSQRAIQAIDCLARSRAGWGAWLEDPSALYGGADGVAFGMERNRAIGNSLIPHIPQLIGEAILRAEAGS